MTHGTTSAYARGCRCDACRAAQAAYMREYRHRNGSRPFRQWQHGSVTGYQKGCRCEPCKGAHSDYQRQYRSRRRRELRKQPAWTIADEVLDFLQLEGWATASELAYRFGRNVEAVERVLRKLRAEGLLRSRFVELAFANGKERLEGRTEWRAV